MLFECDDCKQLVDEEDINSREGGKQICYVCACRGLAEEKSLEDMVTMAPWLCIIVMLILAVMALCGCDVVCAQDTWLTTAYCSCSKCCGKSDGITASGKKAHEGTIACNWLPFGTQVRIEGKVYTVEDRGAKSLFGDKNNHIKHIDIWFPSHKEALSYGKQYKKVEVMKCAN